MVTTKLIPARNAQTAAIIVLKMVNMCGAMGNVFGILGSVEKKVRNKLRSVSEIVIVS